MIHKPLRSLLCGRALREVQAGVRLRQASACGGSHRALRWCALRGGRRCGFRCRLQSHTCEIQAGGWAGGWAAGSTFPRYMFAFASAALAESIAAFASSANFLARLIFSSWSGELLIWRVWGRHCLRDTPPAFPARGRNARGATKLPTLNASTVVAMSRTAPRILAILSMMVRARESVFVDLARRSVFGLWSLWGDFVRVLDGTQRRELLQGVFFSKNT